MKMLKAQKIGLLDGQLAKDELFAKRNAELRKTRQMDENRTVQKFGAIRVGDGRLRIAQRNENEDKEALAKEEREVARELAKEQREAQATLKKDQARLKKDISIFKSAAKVAPKWARLQKQLQVSRVVRGRGMERIHQEYRDRWAIQVEKESSGTMEIVDLLDD